MRRFYSYRFKQHVSLVDTSNEIVGEAAQPHFCLGSSRRFQVLRWRDLHLYLAQRF